jgi:hypothetical protein
MKQEYDDREIPACHLFNKKDFSEDIQFDAVHTLLRIFV